MRKRQLKENFILSEILQKYANFLKPLRGVFTSWIDFC